LLLLKKLLLTIVLCWAAMHLVFALPLILVLAFVVPLIGGFILFVSVGVACLKRR